MIHALPLLLGIMLLSGPDDPRVDRTLAARMSAEADTGMHEIKPVAEGERSAKISSVRSDYDRNEKVVMFDENVCVEYSTEYVMHSDRLFVFLSGSNELSRIVAVGNVAITNDNRVGSCAMATFWRRTSEIDMFGNDKGVQARMADETGNDLRGSRIRFWLDSEQVDVDNPDIQVNRQDGGKLL